MVKNINNKILQHGKENVFTQRWNLHEQTSSHSICCKINTHHLFVFIKMKSVLPRDAPI